MGGKSGGDSSGANSMNGAGDSNAKWMQIGKGMMDSGSQSQANSDAMLTALAKMGTPPNVSGFNGATPVAGQQLLGQYQAAMKPPTGYTKTRAEYQTNPGIGQLLTGG